MFIFTGCGFKEITVEGYVYKDEIKNNEYDLGEPPLKGVLVQSGKLMTETDSDGYFRIKGEIVGETADIYLYLSKKNYVSKRVKVVIQSGDEKNGTTIFFPDYPDLKIVMQSNN